VKAAELFALIAQRLGRDRSSVAPPRDEIGVPAFHRTNPLGAEAMDRTALAARFRRELEAVGGVVVPVRSRADVWPALQAELSRIGAARIVSSSRTELAEASVAALWDELGCAAWQGGDASPAAFRALCAEADAGITPVDFAVAASGTLVLTAAPGRPRSVSLLPRVHIALVRTSQLVARLGEAMEALLARPGSPSSSTLFVTGPSRTSDIENDLTIGVHGPAAVIVILCEE
jgi:L-lactate dehydrogenase complex protein LldG